MPLMSQMPNLTQKAFCDYEVRQKQKGDRILTGRELAERIYYYPGLLAASFIVPTLGFFVAQRYPKKQFGARKRWLSLAGLLCFVLWVGAIYLVGMLGL